MPVMLVASSSPAQCVRSRSLSSRRAVSSTSRRTRVRAAAADGVPSYRASFRHESEEGAGVWKDTRIRHVGDERTTGDEGVKQLGVVIGEVRGRRACLLNVGERSLLVVGFVFSCRDLT